VVAQRVTKRRAGIAVAAIAALLTSACAAGQQAETAEESPTLDGTNADVGKIALRGLAIESPHGIAYQPGSSATVKIVIVNRGSSTDRLTSITSPAASGWAAYGGAAASSSASSGPAAEVLKPLSAVAITPGDRVSYGTPDATGTLLLTQVKQAIRPGTQISMTFTFADAGSVKVTVPVQLSTNPPTAVLPGPSATGQVG
jgi:copper(I)-binding protein